MDEAEIVVGLDVVGDHLDEVVDGPGDALAGHDFLPVMHQLVECVHVVPAGHGELDEGIGDKPQSNRFPVDDRRDLADDSLFLQPLDSTPAGRLAHSGFLSDLGYRKRCVALQDSQNAYV